MGDCEAVIGLDGRKEERQKVGFWQRPDHQNFFKNILLKKIIIVLRMAERRARGIRRNTR